MKKQRVFSLAATVGLMCFAQSSYAVKEDWVEPAGHIGFGVMEATPKTNESGQFVTTTIDLTYDIDANHAGDIAGGQIAVLPCRVMKEKNNISDKDLVAYMKTVRGVPGDTFHMQVRVTISKEELLCVLYGPWKGILMFDSATAVSAYKISASSEAGATLRWVDHDAGDVLIFDYDAVPELKKSGLLIRVYLIRDKKLLLDPKSYRIESFELHPDALKRVNLLESKW
jgi:hypothetical protein